MDISIRENRGVTLIELMIALVIAAILVAGIYSLFISQQQSYSVQDRVVGIQQDARAALMIMARDIRMGGFSVGPGSIAGFTDGVNIFKVPAGGSNMAIDPHNHTDEPDMITVVFGAIRLGEVVTTSPVGTDTEIELTENVNNYFKPAGTIISSKAYCALALQKNLVFNVTQVDDEKIRVSNYPSGGLANNTTAYGVLAITYSLGNDGILRRNTGTGAESLIGDGVNTFVEDLQFAYRIQGSNDWIYDNDTASWPTGMTAADIRMVRVSIIVRTVVPDPKDTSFSRPDCEDHPGDSTFPGCRRRVFTTIVTPRNMNL